MSKIALIALLLLGLQTPVMAQEARPGIGVDARGGAVIDPTKNVLDLVEAAIRRQDDLRNAQRELFDAKLSGAQEASTLRSHYDRELLKAAVDRLDSEAKLRAEFSTAINATEKDRVNAIRSVDVGALAIATERANTTASALAKTVQDSAATLSTLVQTTAAETNRNIQQQFTAISARVAALEQSQSKGEGKAIVNDPAYLLLLQEVKTLRDSTTSSAGKGEGISATVAAIGAGLIVLLMMLAIVVTVILRRAPATRR